MVLKFQRTDGMRDALYRILLTVCKVVGWVYRPFAARLMVIGMTYPVQNRVPQIHVRRGHINLGAQNARAVSEFALPHSHKQIAILGHTPRPKGAISAGLGQCAAIHSRLIGRQVTDIG